ncbi:hypothetical protein AF67_00065 [Streptococcus uberis 6780]|nr:hypothetical protein AF67_00065 [Streptococcus uberis 6780]KKF61769.1 hypothetical protein AF69_08255 [Streptococcus uberis 6736]KKF62739.1 hypothetical protein AF58_02745 [Streptococcus uberis C6344]
MISDLSSYVLEKKICKRLSLAASSLIKDCLKEKEK